MAKLGKKRKTKEIGKTVAIYIGVSVAVLISVFMYFGMFEGFELKSLDMKFTLRGPIKFHDLIAFVDIDESAVQNIGTFPFSRDYHAYVIKALGPTHGKAFATFFDVNFAEKSPSYIDESAINAINEALESLTNEMNKVQENLTLIAENLVPKQNVVDAIKVRLSDLASSQSGINLGVSQINERLNLIKDELPNIAINYDKFFADSAREAGNVYISYFCDPPEKKGVKSAKFIKKSKRLLGLIKHLAIGEMGEILISGEITDKSKVEEINNFIRSVENFTIRELKYLIGDEDGKLKEVQREFFKKLMKNRIKVIEDKLKYIKKDSYPVSEEVGSKFQEIVKLTPPNEEIASSLKGSGYVASAPDKDGVTRRTPLVRYFNGRMYPSVDFIILKELLKVKTSDVEFKPDKYILLKNALFPGEKKRRNCKIPITGEGDIIINWVGRWAEPSHQSIHKSYFYVWSYAMILEYLRQGISKEEIGNAMGIKIDDEYISRLKKFLNFFKNKIIFIGLTATGTHDINPIPFEPLYPMVGMHANVINTVLLENFIIRTPLYVSFILIIIFCVFISYFSALLKQLPGLLFTLGSVVFYFGINFSLFKFLNLWVDMVPQILALFLTYLFVIVYRFMTEEKEKKMIKGMFQTYVPPALVDTLVQNPDKLKLGGERMNLTALFSDVAGFTSISEKLTPEELVELLNEYLTAMTDIVFKYDGTLDKYEGDAVMAVFGAPIWFPNHATNACYTCLEMQETLVELRKKWKAEGKPECRARIGLNTGDMIAGNMGSKTRFNYTVMGDAVNLASRLEGANKQYGTYIMISEFTYEQAKDNVQVRELDLIAVKGKALPVKVYELLARKTDKIETYKLDAIEQYLKGLEAYKQRRWDDGIKFFEKALQINPDDEPSKVYKQRCIDFKIDPPPDDWDGVFIMKTK